MFKLLQKISLLILLIVGTIAAVWFWNPYEKEDLETAYSASVIDKFHRIDSLKSPKIVLIAGSNFAYGINSEMIEKQLKMPVANMAIHYNLGTDFMLRSLENKLNAGDIVVVGFEYIVNSGGEMQEKLLVKHFFPPAENWISYKNLKDKIVENSSFYLFQFRSIIRRLIHNEHFRPEVSGTYDIFFRKGFNNYGDLISHLNNPPVPKLPESLLDDYYANFEKPIADLNDFNKKMKKKGVKVYFSYPTYAITGYNKDKKTIKKIEKQFDSMAKFSILGKPEDFVFPDSLYQDMIYHLNVRGRDVRTQHLIDLLKSSQR